MKILLTGAAVFLGSYLSQRLIHDGHQVTALDDARQRTPDISRAKHILSWEPEMQI